MVQTEAAHEKEAEEGGETASTADLMWGMSVHVSANRGVEL